jgi:glycosyltransferase involved in cell wall biosynthesis
VATDDEQTSSPQAHDRAAATRGTTLMLVENMSVPSDPRVWPECRALRDAGFEVVVVCPQGDEADRLTFELFQGVEIHRFPLPGPSEGLAGYMREYATAFVRVAALVRRLGRNQRFDIVHAANPPDFLLAAAWPLKRRGTCFIFDHHDLAPELYQTRFRRGRDVLYRLARGLERLSFGLADVVIATNDSYRRVAITRGKKDPDDVFVVRNAPDSRRFRPVVPDPALKHGKQNLLSYVGLMGPQDGLDCALRALRHLVALRGEDWHATFVGDGDALAEIKALTRDLGLEHLVDFPGFVRDYEEIVRLLSTSDVCMAPEPKGPLNDVSTLIKIGEYMAVGTAIVAFDLTESRVTAGDAALYAAPNDEASFARCLDELLSDPERRERMGALGRSRLLDLFSWDASTRALLEAYERALALSRPERQRAC